MENEIIAAPVPETVTVVDIQFRPGQKVYFFDPDVLELQPGDHVIMDTARGLEYGICAAGAHDVSVKDVVLPLRKVVRIATEADEKIVRDNRAKERKAFEVCHRKINEMGLDMQLVSVECAFDGSKLLFFFTAEERVDFRELVKNLAFTFHTRIELRQIGVRDKAKMVGGLGICGRPFCCTSFLDDFQPVSIKMAKTQNLSLNPTKISGTCGRLMCCLKYEQDAYEYLLSTCPKEESFVDTPEGRGTVVEINLLRQTVKVRMEDAPDTVGAFSVEEIAVLRNGKAKKNDPPIPADLAPISGGGKRVRREKKTEDNSFLDPIKFRYREDAVVEETVRDPEEPAAETAQPKDKPNNRRNRNRGGKPKQDGQNKPKGENKPTSGKPKQEGQNKPKGDSQNKPKGENKPKPNKENPEKQPAGDKPNKSGKRPNRRPNHHHHRKPKPEGGSQQNT